MLQYSLCILLLIVLTFTHMGHINVTILPLYFIINRFDIFAYIKKFSKFFIEKRIKEWKDERVINIKEYNRKKFLMMH
jgi:hypothetical protein